MHFINIIPYISVEFYIYKTFNIPHIYSLQSIQDIRVHNFYFVGKETEYQKGWKAWTETHILVISV